MPLRVKCRCGQELVLRFNEWVYALFGLLVLSLLVNGTALVLLVAKVGPGGGERGVAAHDSSPAATASSSSGAAAASAPSGVELPAAPAGREQGFSTGKGAPEAGALAVPAAGAGSPPPAASAAVLPEGAKAQKLPGGEPGEAKPRPRAPGRPPQNSLLEGASALVRLLVLTRSEDLRLPAAFLHDVDPVLRRAALARLLQAPAAAQGASSRELLLLALPAAPLFCSERGGRDLLRRLAGEDRGADPLAWQEWGREALGLDPRAAGPAGLPLIAGLAEGLRSTSSAVQALEKAYGKPGTARAGTDLLLALDITESMEEPLKALSRCRWLFSALSWAIPGVRAGLLLYADEVTGSVPLGSDPKALSAALSALKAEGGGDVPEGVHEALKAALQLGRFNWRQGAQKHIVFVGDGPPPRAEVPSLLSLARECHAEAGYQIHAISVNPEEGRKATLHFPELAAAGGGRAVTAPCERIADEIFLALFPAECREELERALPSLVAALPGAP